MEESLIEKVMEHILHFRPIVRDCYTAITIKNNHFSFTVVTKKHKQRDGKKRKRGGGGAKPGKVRAGGGGKREQRGSMGKGGRRGRVR